jgi:uncharacterized protein
LKTHEAAVLTGAEGVRRAVGPTILLHSGAYFDFEDPAAQPVVIEDIAHALANLCRFTGHTQRFYSVAEHSVWCSEIVPKEHALAALLHDAVEAFVGDVSRPLKALLPEYREVEKRIEAAVLPMFGLSLPLHPAVKEADARMLLVEQAQAMGNADDWPDFAGLQPADVRLGFWHPASARTFFLQRYYELVRGFA